MIFSDYSVDSQRLRCQAQPSEQDEIKNSMFFSAKLRVHDDKTVHIFTSTEDASQWLESLPKTFPSHPFTPLTYLRSKHFLQAVWPLLR